MLDKVKDAIRLVFDSPTDDDRRAAGHGVFDRHGGGGRWRRRFRTFKASMEKLFGPGGKFRLQFVAVDDQTVLLAAATEAQVAKAIEVIGRPATTDVRSNRAARRGRAARQAGRLAICSSVRTGTTSGCSGRWMPFWARSSAGRSCREFPAVAADRTGRRRRRTNRLDGNGRAGRRRFAASASISRK